MCQASDDTFIYKNSIIYYQPEAVLFDTANTESNQIESSVDIRVHKMSNITLQDSLMRTPYYYKLYLVMEVLNDGPHAQPGQNEEGKK